MSKRLNTVEAADLAGVSMCTISRAARDGRLTHYGARNRFLFEKDDVLRFAKERAANPLSRRGRPRPAETNAQLCCCLPKLMADWVRRKADEQGVSTY